MDTLSTSTQAISVVTAGNWLILHDSIGPRVLELIQDRYGPEVELCDVGNAGLALLDHLHRQDLMIVVDACLLGGHPGEVRVIEPDLAASPLEAGSVHQIGPLETLFLADRLYSEKMPARILVIAVETNGIDANTHEAACQQAVSILDREIAGWQSLQMEI
ncbi:MAG: hydrogenase maturation protease [Gammaproteobacteria bacterium]|nr:hydrogenase maturation protease [Gammaproteobacteria bacterium]